MVIQSHRSFSTYVDKVGFFSLLSVPLGLLVQILGVFEVEVQGSFRPVLNSISVHLASPCISWSPLLVFQGFWIFSLNCQYISVLNESQVVSILDRFIVSCFKPSVKVFIRIGQRRGREELQLAVIEPCSW